MQKLLYFIPACLLAVLDVTLLILGLDGIPLQHLLWLALFAIAGLLLSSKQFWGAAFGLIPAFEFIYMSSIYTGQVVDIELPLGIALTFYYLICAFIVHKKRA